MVLNNNQIYLYLNGEQVADMSLNSDSNSVVRYTYKILWEMQKMSPAQALNEEQVGY